MAIKAKSKAKTAKKPAPKSNGKAKKAAAARKPAAAASSAPAAPSSPWIWHELVTGDVAAAKRFYGALFGWGASDNDFAGRPYTLFRSGSKDVGGCMTIPLEDGKPCCPPNWLTYVGVDDVDATARKAADLGARVLAGPEDVPAIGRFAVIVDPQGATFAIFKPSM